MNYPIISEYIESIKCAEDNFATLTNLRPVLDNNGNPIMSSGNFAVVFKMKDIKTNKIYAVKCFLKEQEGREQSYQLIAEELEDLASNYLTSIRYMKNELFVDSANSNETEFPVLLMEWIEGVTLDKYIRTHIESNYGLAMLVYRFSKLASWLLSQPFAHGDLKLDNILVKEDGSLVLVDYDGMYVPAMKGQKAREIGSPDFRHPQRTEEQFDEHIDDFAIASILLSLKAISLTPQLLSQYGATDRLLFSQKDYSDLSSSNAINALRPLMADSELNLLYSLFLLAHSKQNLSMISFHLLYFDRPIENVYKLGSSNKNNNLSNPDVLFELGCCYYEGEGIQRDEKKAIELWHNAAKMGHSNAERMIDFSEDIFWYDKTNWKIEMVRDFNQEELNSIRKVIIVRTPHGACLKFFLKDFIMYGHLSNNYSISIGKNINPKNIEAIILSKPGECNRFEFQIKVY